MPKILKQEDIERIMAEADDLLKRTDPELLQDMEDERRIKLEQHAEKLQQLKADTHEKIGKEGAADKDTYSDGVHQAMDDIVKAMKSLAAYLA